MTDRWRPPAGPAVLAAGAVILAACLPYLSTINDYFVQDDFGVIQLMARRPWTTFFRWFTMPWTEDIWLYTPDEIRPFVALSYVMTASWGAAAPSAHHVLNILIHAGNGLLVMGIARTSAGLNLAAATLAALVFVVLPVQAESVAWVTGRVDSMPTLFYLAAFMAYVQWRNGGRHAYAWSLAWFFVALFSKQNTITLAAALVAYDAIVLRRPVRPGWAWLRPYVPFVLMTVGFLWVRYAVVGTVVRESQLNAEGLRGFLEVVGHHTQRTVFGHLSPVRAAEWIAAAIVAAIAAFGFTRLARADRQRLAAAALFFGGVWWVLGVAPIIVAGYESPRHVYLAAAGWAILMGIAARAIAAAAGGRAPNAVMAAAAAAIISFYAIQLWTVVGQWNTAADISRRAVAALEREAQASEPGTLVIAGVPISSWEWASPFMARPPYTQTDLTAKVRIITPWRLHCCRAQWLDYTRARLGEWTAAPAPIVALYANPRTGAISRLTDEDYPSLRAIVTALEQIETRDALDRAIIRLLQDLAANEPAG